MNTLPTKEENPRGLHQKYNITKADGSPVDPGFECFVLRLDDGCSDEWHKAACRLAVSVYAQLISDYLPELSQDLLSRYGALSLKQSENVTISLKAWNEMQRSYQATSAELHKSIAKNAEFARKLIDYRERFGELTKPSVPDLKPNKPSIGGSFQVVEVENKGLPCPHCHKFFVPPTCPGFYKLKCPSCLQICSLEVHFNGCFTD